MTATESFDVAIVGAGPAGSATALALLQHGARVALIERRCEAEDRMGESLRGIAAESLRELGVWEAFRCLEQRPSYRHRAAWGGLLEERDMSRLRYGPDLHLDRSRFDALLVDAAVARGAALFRPANVCHLAIDASNIRFALEYRGETIDVVARRLVDATGHRAKIARRLGARRLDADRLIGIARSYARGAREPSTLVEAADEGWWYSAPQPGDRIVALFLTDGDLPARAARRDEVWAACLKTAPLTRDRLRAAEAIGSPRTYLATPAVLDWDPEGPLLPVGDAALSFDPIAADGLCFALRSGLEAAAVLLGARGSTRAYRDGVLRIYRDHLARRERVYAAERQLRPTAFWRRPRAGISVAELTPAAKTASA
jgi:flavin-dependent dehydrogenase